MAESKKPYYKKKKQYKSKRPNRSVPAKQSSAMLAWRAMTNNRIQQLEEQMLSLQGGIIQTQKNLEFSMEAVFAEESVTEEE